MLQALTDNLTEADIERGINDYASIGGLVDGGLKQQVEFDMQALQRAAILSNEKFRGVRWMLTEGSLRISCTWDNSAENQPVVAGAVIEPQDVQWGEGTTDEMCLGILLVTRP